MLQLGGEKMSKSLGNLITIEEFLSQHEGDVMRMMVLNSSYRNPLTFTDEVIQQAEKALERLRQALRPMPAPREHSIEADQRLEQQIKLTRHYFIESMDDDFNSAGAMGYLFDLVRVLNQSRDTGASEAQIKTAQDTLRELMTVLGLRTERASSAGSEADPFINLLIEIRKELRQQKLWSLSDLVRNRLVDLGVILEDSKDGTTWKWK
jgi:cysteinyl-tRNA synthetase